MIEPIITIIAIGAIGGMVRGILGYSQQADEGEAFNYAKFAKSVTRAAIAGSAIVLGITTATGSTITQATYISAFFMAVGADVLTKETYGAIKGN